MTRAVVVGAGLAGLSAVLQLERRGVDTVLVERSRLLGGKTTSFVINGVEVDSGQHVHLACCTEYLDFVESLGMAGSLWTQPRFAVTVLARGRAPSRLVATRGLPATVALLPSFARYRHLDLGGRVRVARAMRALHDRARAGETFAAWLQRHGQEAADIAGFWALFVVPALNATPDEAAAEDALFVLRTAFDAPDNARIGWSTVPLARIAAAAAEHATDVRLRTAVTGLLTDGDAVRGVRCHDGTTIDADAVVLAVPPARASAILGDGAAYGVRGLDAFTSRAIVDVHLWYDTGALGLDFAAIVDSPVQWVFEKEPGRLCCSLSAADSFAARPEDELVAMCDAELAAVWPRLNDAHLVGGAATRDPDATFVPSPGLHRPSWRTNRANLVLAGAWTDTGWPATMESAVRSGRVAAANVALHGGVPAAREHAHA